MGSLNVEQLNMTTTENVVGELTKTLFNAEIKATETAAVVGLYKTLCRLRVGTPDLERLAVTLSRQAMNKLGTRTTGTRTSTRTGQKFSSKKFSSNDRNSPSISSRPKAGAGNENFEGDVNLVGDDLEIMNDANYDEAPRRLDNPGHEGGGGVKVRCGRDPGLLCKLARIKEEQAAEMTRDLKESVRETKDY